MGNMEMITAKEKGMRVIESCETILQTCAAEKYIELYYKKFEDYISYQNLSYYLEEQKERIL